MAEPTVVTIKTPPTILGLAPQDRLMLLQLATDLRVRESELALAQVRYETAKLLADAAGNAVTQKMGVPDAAKNVTIDHNTGILSYELPE